MKHSKKLLIAALLLTFVLALSALVACAPKVTLLSVELQQTTYVVGQQLKGSLKVDVKGEEQLWEFTQEGVTVSGYNPNQLGEQTVTVSYDEQTVSAKVTVVPRVVAQGIKQDYVVGDKFDTTQGTLRFTRDDGTTKDVFFTDANLTLTGFASNVEALPLTITATYVDNGTTLTGEFAVNVYGIDNLSLTRPVNRQYASHDTALDLNGCFLTVTTALGQSFVQVTENMCSGFDLSVVNEANPTATQTITVTYAGKSKAFEIDITYSDVSYIKDNVAALAEVDWSGEETPTLTPEQGELARNMAEKYFALSDVHKAMISPEESAVVMKNAARYVFGLYLEQWNVYEAAFALESYQAVKDAYTQLSVESAPLRVYGRLLEKISDEFGANEFFKTITIKSYLSGVVTEEQFAGNLAIFNYAITLHEGLTVPANWQAAELTQYAQQIDNVVLAINSNSYRGSAYRQLYSVLTNWRENKDYFDILYTYYFNAENTNVLLSLVDIYLPGPMEEMYICMEEAFIQAVGMQNKQVVDSSLFVLNYNRAYETAKQIASGDNAMYKFLYANSKLKGFLVDGDGNDAEISFAGLMYYLTVTDILQFGWNKHQGPMLGNEQFDDMWDKYLVVLEGALTPDYVKGEQFPIDLKAMLDTFVTLAPNTQYEFIRSVNAFYDQSFPTYALDTSEYCYSYFTYFIVEYYETVVTPEEMKVLKDMLVAIECHSLTNHRAGSHTEFLTRMEAVATAFGNLSDEQKASFTANFGTAYSRYELLWKIGTNQVTGPEADFGEEFNPLVQAILDAISQMAEIERAISAGELTANRGVVRFLSAFEYAEYLSDYIIENASAEAVHNFYYNKFVPLDGQTFVTLEWLMYYYRISYGNLLYSAMVDSRTALAQIYFDTNLEEFLIKAYPVIWYNPPENLTNIYTDAVMLAINSFRDLTQGDKMLLMALDVNNDYYGNVDKFFKLVLNEQCVPVAEKLVQLEQTYLAYVAKTAEITLQNLVDLSAQVTELKNALQGTDVNNFEAFLLEMYNYYVTAVQELQQQSQA
ncbi:MAG: bacterial Ig-like domain-containing protein [Clostridia bacterium]|nr:bacterial Ig-like domain-containing protein [Clostridia bacterium]